MPVDNGNDGHRYTFGAPTKGWPSFGSDGKVKPPRKVDDIMREVDDARRLGEPTEGPLCRVEGCPRLAHPGDVLCHVHFWDIV